MKLTHSTLAGMDLVAFRFENNGEFIQDVVYDNNISEAELRAYIASKYDMYPQEIEIAR